VKTGTPHRYEDHVKRDRRRFLRQTVSGSLFLFIGPGIIFRSAAAPADLRFSFFSETEFEIFKAVADRILGPRPDGAPSLTEIAGRADIFLAGEHPEVQDQFHLLLALFDSAVIATLFDLRFSSFLAMSADAQDGYLNDWMRSPLAFRRTAFQGLKRICMSVYYSHPDSWEKIGFDGAYGKYA
jgi:hypothetical protein